MSLRFLAVPALLLLADQLKQHKEEEIRELFHLASLKLREVGDRLLYLSSGLSAAYTFFLLSLACALIVDWSLVMRMFVSTAAEAQDAKKERWERYRTLNWISSGVSALSLTHLMSVHYFDGLYSTADISDGKQTTENRIILAVSFLSIAYQVGFFGVSFISHDVSLTSPRLQNKSNSNSGSDVSVTAFVPPVYYLGVVSIVWQTDSSFLIRAIVVVTSMVFFAAINLSYRLKAQRIREKEIETSGNRKREEDESDAGRKKSSKLREKEGENNGRGLYTKMSTPEGAESRIWRKQFFYDTFTYCLPLFVAGLFMEQWKLLFCGISTFIALFMPVYDFVVTYLFFQPSGLQNQSNAASRLATYPNKERYVDGWFHLLDSDSLPTGKVEYVYAVGRHLAVFRGEDGCVRCLDAHCVHLGANMAEGGRVVGNCLECPFHAWQFDGEGHCTKIPYQSNIPAQAKARAYSVCEYYGLVLVWIHALDSVPSYYPPNRDGLDAGRMAFRGERETVVNMHISEFAENSTDFMHFNPLHGRMTFPFSPIIIPGITVNHRPDWKEGTGEEGHMSWFMDDADLSLFGVHLPETAASAVITFVGPASLVFFTFDTPIGNIVLFQTHTPLEPLRLKTSFRWYADASMPRALVWYICGNWLAQWQNDIRVWENKIFANKPTLVKGDGPMMRQRRWFKQFYSSPVVLEYEKMAEEGDEVDGKDAKLKGKGTAVQDTKLALAHANGDLSCCL